MERMKGRTKEEIVEEFRCASICDAAMGVIARKGIDDTTIQDVADEAGIAKGTVYLYFRDREELLAKTADRAFEKLLADLEPAFDAPGSFEETLLRVVIRQLQFFDDNRALFRATLALTQRDGGQSKRQSGCYQTYSARLEQLFAGAKTRGEMRDLDPAAVSAVYRDCLRGVIFRRLDVPPSQKKSRTPVEADARFIVSILLRGIQERS